MCFPNQCLLQSGIVGPRAYKHKVIETRASDLFLLNSEMAHLFVISRVPSVRSWFQTINFKTNTMTLISLIIRTWRRWHCHPAAKVKIFHVARSLVLVIEGWIVLGACLDAPRYASGVLVNMHLCHRIIRLGIGTVWSVSFLLSFSCMAIINIDFRAWYEMSTKISVCCSCKETKCD